jgi:hypothetical protein
MTALITLKILDESTSQDYASFLANQTEGMFYYSLGYKALIEEHLQCTAEYLMAYKEEHVVGILPIMYSQPGCFGVVANSLPYYGSNGSMLIDHNLNDEAQQEVSKYLLNEGISRIEERGCGAYTFVTNPFCDEHPGVFKNVMQLDPVSDRISQLTPLPEKGEEAEERLMQVYHNPRPRNIRKAIKSGVTVEVSNDQDALDYLYKVHFDNINAIGGIAKREVFFKQIRKHISNEQFKVYVAKLEGKPIAALLLFYCNQTVEYFTPATEHEYRNLQPSALLIHEAMKDAMELDFKWWNWGGTWRSQTGVYDFKRKWGAEELEYQYYTKITDAGIYNASPEKLLSEYPNFYVIAFDKLNQDEQN